MVVRVGHLPVGDPDEGLRAATVREGPPQHGTVDPVADVAGPTRHGQATAVGEDPRVGRRTTVPRPMAVANDERPGCVAYQSSSSSSSQLHRSRLVDDHDAAAEPLRPGEGASLLVGDQAPGVAHGRPGDRRAPPAHRRPAPTALERRRVVEAQVARTPQSPAGGRHSPSASKGPEFPWVARQAGGAGDA